MTKVRTQRGKPAKGDHRTYETSEISAKAASLTIAAVAGIVFLVCVGVAGLLLWLGAFREPTATSPSASASPLLQTDERADRIAIETRARARLGAKAGGIPVEQAMRQRAAVGWDAPR
jgi:hypothetical protein